MKTTLRDQLKGRLEDLKGKVREIASVIFGRHAPEGKGKVRHAGISRKQAAKVAGR